MTDWDAVHKFMLAGNALFTIESTTTDKHFTFKVEKIKDKFKQMNEGDELWIAKKLVGQDNETSYRVVGTIWKHADGKTGYKPKGNDQVFGLFYHMLDQRSNLLDKINFYHANQCGKCGRTLTTPESISIGLGPVCRGE